MIKNIWIIFAFLIILVIFVGLFFILKERKEEPNSNVDSDVKRDLDEVESLSEMIDIMKSGRGDFQDGMTDFEIEEYQKQVIQELDIQIPDDYVDFLKSMNVYHYGLLTSVTFFGKCDKSYSDIISQTKKFYFSMEDWETGQLQEKFVVLGKYHDGEGFIFYLKDSKKYVIVDYLVDVSLDDITKLNTADTFLDVLKYIGKKSDNYK